MRVYLLGTLSAMLIAAVVSGCGQGTPPSADSKPATQAQSADAKPMADPTTTAATDDDTAWHVTAKAQSLPAAQQEQLDRAMKARDTMFQRLLGKLTETIDDAGPAAAIAVCRDAAPEIAAAVSDEHDLRIGRTSFRLRNPKNEPPDWAAKTVAEQVDEPRYFMGPEDQLGVLLPITLQAPCATCHGPKEKIPTKVQEALAANYPNDKATGFAPGELRGWFWIEVPAVADE